MTVANEGNVALGLGRSGMEVSGRPGQVGTLALSTDGHLHVWMDNCIQSLPFFGEKFKAADTFGCGWDIRAHRVRELSPILDVAYVPSKDNMSDIFTKNTATELFAKHAGRFWDVLDTKNTYNKG